MVILNKHVSAYAGITWSEWKDSNRKQMRSEGDNWSKATLQGNDIWECLDKNRISRLHLVQWKPEADTLYKVACRTGRRRGYRKRFHFKCRL